jgi:hypothetical protein
VKRLNGAARHLQSARVLPALISTFSGTVKPAGILSIAATNTRRVASTNGVAFLHDLQLEVAAPNGGTLPSVSFLDAGRLTAPLATNSPALTRSIQPRNRPNLPSSPPENFTMGGFAAVFIGVWILGEDGGENARTIAFRMASEYSGLLQLCGSSSAFVAA